MSGFTESSDEDSAAYAYYRQASDAYERGELELADELCNKAAKLCEHTFADVESKIYCLWGVIAHKRGNLDAAEEWYRTSLEIDERNGDESGAAKACNNLSLLAIDRLDFKSAEKWSRKTLIIAEKHGNDEEISITCQRLGVVAYRQGNLNAAEKWYQSALGDITESCGCGS